jgi:hypothetical protein
MQMGIVQDSSNEKVAIEFMRLQFLVEKLGKELCGKERVAKFDERYMQYTAEFCYKLHQRYKVQYAGYEIAFADLDGCPCYSKLKNGFNQHQKDASLLYKAAKAELPDEPFFWDGSTLFCYMFLNKEFNFKPWQETERPEPK